MKSLVLVCGPAAIGKSTFSKKYIAEHPGIDSFIIAADEVRKEMCGGYDKFLPNRNMMPIYEEMIRRANALCESHDNLIVIFDTTMLYDERRLFFVRHMPGFDHKELILLKLTDYNTCLIRNKQRIPEKWVPDDVILSMARGYYDPSEDCKAHFDVVKEIYVD